LLLAALGGLGSVGYLASMDDPSELTWAWIFEGHKLSSDEILAISDTLDAEGIAHVTEHATGKVGVKPARKAEALAALSKHKVFPRTLDDLSQEEVGSLFDTPRDRQERKLAARQRRLKKEIEGLHNAIQSATVEILVTPTRPGFNAPCNVGAYVYLQIETNRLSHRVIERIENFLKGSIPDLNPKAITVVDNHGFDYLSADNPALTEQVKIHAREETWREQIAEELQHIPGIGVSVLLETVQAPPPPELPPLPAEDLVVTNGRVVIDADPPAEVVAPPSQPNRTKANVLVRVPRSFYFLDFFARNPNRQPNQEDLDQMKETTERFIKDAVEIHIPKEDLGVVKVSVIQDDLASPRQMVIPSVAEPHRPWIWVALSGVVVLASVGAVGAMVRLATRRQPTRPSRSSWRPGFVVDGPNDPLPGPSERVRELIRLNPEAAAGVLQRWIGQGGAMP
jgi:flagellar biosynthesis/type III secretory pathway M-ring protein FliF/YscJ